MQGWQDDRTASLIFVTEGQSVTFSFIIDRPLAQEMAQLVRNRVARSTPDRPPTASSAGSAFRSPGRSWYGVRSTRTWLSW